MDHAAVVRVDDTRNSTASTASGSAATSSGVSSPSTDDARAAVGFAFSASWLSLHYALRARVCASLCTASLVRGRSRSSSCSFHFSLVLLVVVSWSCIAVRLWPWSGTGLGYGRGLGFHLLFLSFRRPANRKGIWCVSRMFACGCCNQRHDVNGGRALTSFICVRVCDGWQMNRAQQDKSAGPLFLVNIDWLGKWKAFVGGGTLCHQIFSLLSFPFFFCLEVQRDERQRDHM